MNDTTPVVTLPTIPTETATLAVDYGQEDGETIVAIYDRTGHEEQDGLWGEFLGHATLREDATDDDVRVALRAAGWTEGTPMAYALHNAQGALTTWTH